MHVRLHPGEGTIEVDGSDVTASVRRTTLDMHVGRQPEVFLELVAGALVPEVLDVDAVVQVVREASAADAKAIVLAWVETLDPGSIERDLLDDANLETSMGTAVVQTLTRMANDLG
jgi:hypothetical protein